MYYAVGDIHGRYDLVTALYEKIRAEIERDPDYAFGDTIVFLGDYIDRGPQSKEVLDFLMALEDTDTVKHICLMGNHEEFMTYCRRNPGDPQTLGNWLYHGGDKTVDSFGKTMTQICHGHIDDYIEWMEALPIIAQDYDYVFVHAAVDTHTPRDKQSRETCLWKFETYPQAYARYDRIVVHGHITRKVGDKFDTTPHIDIPNNRVWLEVGANFTNKLAAVGLPQPYDPDVEIKVIEVKAL